VVGRRESRDGAHVGDELFLEDSMQQLTMAISGMSCGGCVTNVRKALVALSGTHVDSVTGSRPSINTTIVITMPPRPMPRGPVIRRNAGHGGFSEAPLTQ
jgi:hypothetical protein